MSKARTLSDLASGGAGSPVGSISAFADAVPSDHLECNGAAVSRTTYADLFSYLSTTYGAGDGSTTFNLPDLRGEFIRGFDAGRGVDAGRSLGSAQADEFKEHGFHGTSTTPKNAPTGTQDYVRTDSDTVGNRGGTETRPRNIAMHYGIKF